jgi:hypothetical protein
MYMKRVSILILVFGLASAAWAGQISILGDATIHVGETKVYTVSYSGSPDVRSFDIDVHLSNNNATDSAWTILAGGRDTNFDYIGAPQTTPPSYGRDVIAVSGGALGNIWLKFNITGKSVGTIQLTAGEDYQVIIDTQGNQIYPPSGYLEVQVLDCLYVGRVFNTGMTVSQSMVSRWNYLGKPNCWCCEAQKYGNGDYAGTSSAKVDTSDLTCLKASYGRSYIQSGYKPCCDFNLSGRVDTIDLTILKANYMHIEGTCSDVGIF